MPGNEQRCIQRRIIDFSRDPSNWIFFLPMIAVIFVMFLFFYSGIIRPENTIDVLLALVIAFFSGVQGYSTLSQVRLARERNRIEDLRNELKTAYGPLYTLFNKEPLDVPGPKELLLNSQEKAYPDEIIATQPFLFSSELYDLWREKIQPLGPKYFIDMPDKIEEQYAIPLEFMGRINDKCDRKVREYYKLLKKETE